MSGSLHNLRVKMEVAKANLAALPSEAEHDQQVISLEKAIDEAKRQIATNEVDLLIGEGTADPEIGPRLERMETALKATKEKKEILRQRRKMWDNESKARAAVFNKAAKDLLENGLLKEKQAAFELAESAFHRALIELAAVDETANSFSDKMSFAARQGGPAGELFRYLCSFRWTTYPYSIKPSWIPARTSVGISQMGGFKETMASAHAAIEAECAP